MSLFEFETVVVNFASNSVISIYVFLANNAPGGWPSRKVKTMMDTWEVSSFLSKDKKIGVALVRGHKTLAPARWPLCAVMII